MQYFIVKWLSSLDWRHAKYMRCLTWFYNTCTNISTLVITSSCRGVVRRFQANYPGVRVPSREAVRLLINKFRETGSIVDKKRNVKRCLLCGAETKVIWICWNIRDSPGVSAGLACTRYRRPSHTVNSLYFLLYERTKLIQRNS